jgi:hypothetical protein
MAHIMLSIKSLNWFGGMPRRAAPKFICGKKVKAGSLTREAIQVDGT